MTDLWHSLSQNTDLLAIIRAMIYLVAGYFLARFLSKSASHLYQKQKKPKYSLLIQKIIFYVVFLIFIISALREFGFDLKVLLGATGILTVAFGFASQTSASNFVSGLFLLSESTFEVGDSITVNGVTGDVMSIDLLSVKLKQADSTLIRIPNEMIIKTQVINLSHFSIRRFECNFTVAPKVELSELRNLILPAISKISVCLTEPSPILQIKEIADNGIQLQLLVWAKQKNFAAMKNEVQETLWNVLKTQQISFADSTVNVKLIKGNTDETSYNDIP